MHMAVFSDSWEVCVSCCWNILHIQPEIHKLGCITRGSISQKRCNHSLSCPVCTVCLYVCACVCNDVQKTIFSNMSVASKLTMVLVVVWYSLCEPIFHQKLVYLNVIESCGWKKKILLILCLWRPTQTFGLAFHI